MERCLDCNSLLTKEETVCVECGTKIGGEDTGSAGLVAAIVSTLFYLSAITMVASPFVDKLPSFMFCMLITGALLFVMRTAQDNTQKIRKK
jgi:hypothetical protein